MDENGEPKVLYHGTNNEFTKFNESDRGLYLSEKMYASNYGDKLMPVYVRLENPYIGVPRDKYGNDIDWKSLGHDGWIEKTGINYFTVVAANSNQIKSAEPFTFDDNGELIPLSERFDDENDDIRFSITPETDAEYDNEMQRIKLTERQWLQVRTQAFKKWFGDWEIAQLIRQAQNAWKDSNSKSKFVFSPSERLAEAYKDTLGHEIKSIVLTDDAIRHIKKNHGKNEELRGQVNITPEDIAIIPYVLNNFDTMERSQEHDDKMGNRAVIIKKRINGVSVVATIEKGNDKEFVVTNWEFVKSNALDADNTTPGLNVRNDFDAAKIRKEIDAIKDSLKNSSKVLDENGEPKVVH